MIQVNIGPCWLHFTDKKAAKAFFDMNRHLTTFEVVTLPEPVEATE